MVNVVLVILDTVRKDYFDEHATRLGALADVEFDRCYAPSSWSIPSHASMFAESLPHVHGVHSYNPDYASLDRTFLDDLPHRAVGISANGAVSESFGMDALFDEFVSFAGNDERGPAGVSFGVVSDQSGIRRYLGYITEARRRGALTASLANGLYIKLNELTAGTPLPKIGDFGAAAVVNRAVAASDEEPFVMFLNFIDAHGPMENHRGLDSTVPYRWNSRSMDVDTVRERSSDDLGDYLVPYRDLYAANVRYLDERVAELIERTHRRTDDETVFVVTADYGEELRLPGERDLGHMDFSTPLLHVPFVVIGAEGPDLAEPTSLLDLGMVLRSVVDGDDVPDVSREMVPAERAGMMFHDGEDDYWTRGARTVFDEEGRYAWDERGERLRYDVGPSVDRNCRPVEIPEAAVSAFAGTLEEFLERARDVGRTAAVSDRTESQLKDLGYTV